MDDIHEVLSSALKHQQEPATLAEETVSKLEGIIGKLRAVPVDVEIKVLPVQEANAPLPVDVNSKVAQNVDEGAQSDAEKST